jgi:hypothetical protein
VTDVPPATPALPADPCAALLATERAAIAALGDHGDVSREAYATFGRCLRTPDGGAWAVVLDDLAGVPEDAGVGGQVEGHWSVAHVAPDGTVARSQRANDWVYYAQLGVSHTALVDYDNDGAPEIVVVTRVRAMEAAGSSAGEVLSFRNGAVIPYAPATGISPDESRDVDNDGRTDLITAAPYTDEGNDSPSDFSYEMRGPQFLAHALPDGTFARNDAAAKAFARTQCPARNPRVFGASTENALHDVVCARIWGVPAAAVQRIVTTRCASPQENGSGNPRRPHCGDVRVLTRWIALAPPVTLP